MEHIAQSLASLFVFADILGNDVFCTLQCLLNSCDGIAIHKPACGCLRITLTLKHDDGSQRLKTLFASYLCTCPALWFVRQIDVFQFCCIPTIVYSCFQFIGHFALFFNRLANRFLSFAHFAKAIVPFADVANLHFIKSSRSFLAITGDERNGATFVEHLQCVLHIALIQVQGFCYDLCECVHLFRCCFLLLMISLITSPPMMSPAVAGTNALLAGTLPSTESSGGRIGVSLLQTTLK